MSNLAKCKREGCAPALQTRGELKPEDHHMQYNRYNAMVVFMEDHGVWMDLNLYHADAYEVEQDPHSADDVRISCAKCGKATPWLRRDIEETRRFADGDHRRVVIKRDGNMPAVFNSWLGMVK